MFQRFIDPAPHTTQAVSGTTQTCVRNSINGTLLDNSVTVAVVDSGVSLLLFTQLVEQVVTM